MPKPDTPQTSFPSRKPADSYSHNTDVTARTRTTTNTNNTTPKRIQETDNASDGHDGSLTVTRNHIFTNTQ